jgi:hypothetical protein
VEVLPALGLTEITELAFTIPLVCVNVELFLLVTKLLFKVISPETLRFAMVDTKVVVRFVVAPPLPDPTIIEAQFRVPAPDTVLLTFPEDKLFLEKASLTVNVMAEFTAREPEVPVKVIDLQEASTVTVTVIPLLIMTSSAATGTAEPPQVAVEFQFPVTDAVLVAALALPVSASKPASISNKICMFLRSSKCFSIGLV